MPFPGHQASWVPLQRTLSLMQDVRRIAKAPLRPFIPVGTLCNIPSWLPKYLAKLPSHPSDLTIELDAFAEHLTVNCVPNPAIGNELENYLV